MKAILQKISFLILCALLLCAVLPGRAAAGFEIPGTCQVQTESGVSYTVKILDHEYDGNTYLSLRDLAVVLTDTEKTFSLEITKNAVLLNPGEAYTAVGGENDLWEDDEMPSVNLRRNELKVGGEPVNYYTIIMMQPSGYYDCFMMAADLAMILDMEIKVPADGFLEIHTQKPFRMTPADI